MLTRKPLSFVITFYLSKLRNECYHSRWWNSYQYLHSVVLLIVRISGSSGLKWHRLLNKYSIIHVTSEKCFLNTTGMFSCRVPVSAQVTNGGRLQYMVSIYEFKRRDTWDLLILKWYARSSIGVCSRWYISTAKNWSIFGAPCRWETVIWQQ